jgi:nitronate monooxygenase
MNQLLQTLEIRLPILQAPMAGISTPAMAAAVSNAGGLGAIGVGASDAQTACQMIRAVRSATDRPFNVNVFCHRPAVRDGVRESAWVSKLAPLFAQYGAIPPRELREIYTSFVVDDAMLRTLLEERPRVVSFHFGLPSAERIAVLRQAGIVLIASATNLREARLIASAGIDAVIAQGFEAGGHRGMFDLEAPDECLGTLALTRLLVRAVDRPVIVAGGIMDGAGIAACLLLGASAAQLGTAFIGCDESAADAGYRRALFSNSAAHTVMTAAISGRPARCLANQFTALGIGIEGRTIPEYPIAYDAGKSLNAAAKAAGEMGFGAHWAGQGASLVRQMPAAALVAQLESELAQALLRGRVRGTEERPPATDSIRSGIVNGSRAFRGRLLAIVVAIVFCTSSVFPLVAGLSKNTASFPQWWGPLDVGIAFFLAILALALLSLAQGHVTKQADDASYRAYRFLIHGILLLCVAVIFWGDWITWTNCVTGFAWRTWLLLYCLPAWLTVLRSA